MAAVQQEPWFRALIKNNNNQSTSKPTTQQPANHTKPTNQPTLPNQPTNQQTKPTNDMLSVSLQKPRVPQLVTKFPASYKNQSVITLPTTAPLLIPNLHHINPVHVLPSCYFKINFNIIQAAAILISTHK
jgi:hypothetical protein